MAFKPMQRGAITDRLRRFFGLTGVYTPVLDELVSPVANIADLTAQPYDISAERFCYENGKFFDGTEPAWMVGVKNTTGSLVVIDRVLVNASNIVLVGVGSQPNPAPVTDHFVLSRDLVSRNVGGFETGTNLAPRPTGMTGYHSQIGGANRTTGVLQIPAASSVGPFYDIELGWILGADMCVQLTYNASINLNEQMIVGIFGRIMTDPVSSVPA